jgi:hypothetical protein
MQVKFSTNHFCFSSLWIDCFVFYLGRFQMGQNIYIHLQQRPAYVSSFPYCWNGFKWINFPWIINELNWNNACLYALDKRWARPSLRPASIMTAPFTTTRNWFGQQHTPSVAELPVSNLLDWEIRDISRSGRKIAKKGHFAKTPCNKLFFFLKM